MCDTNTRPDFIIIISPSFTAKRHETAQNFNESIKIKISQKTSFFLVVDANSIGWQKNTYKIEDNKWFKLPRGFYWRRVVMCVHVERFEDGLIVRMTLYIFHRNHWNAGFFHCLFESSIRPVLPNFSLESVASHLETHTHNTCDECDSIIRINDNSTDKFICRFIVWRTTKHTTRTIRVHSEKTTANRTIVQVRAREKQQLVYFIVSEFAVLRVSYACSFFCLHREKSQRWHRRLPKFKIFPPGKEAISNCAPTTLGEKLENPFEWKFFRLLCLLPRANVIFGNYDLINDPSINT